MNTDGNRTVPPKARDDTATPARSGGQQPQVIRTGSRLHTRSPCFKAVRPVNTNMLSGLTTGNILHAEIVQRGVHYHGTPSTIRVPAQLMPASRHFVDRQAARPPGVSAVVVQDGAGGVGKTVLALTCLHSKADRFPDVLLYADFGATGTGPKLPHTALGRFLRDLGVPQAVPGGLQERTALYRTVTASGALGILLDDAQCAEHRRALCCLPPPTLWHW
jgi:hypothetical protein